MSSYADSFRSFFISVTLMSSLLTGEDAEYTDKTQQFYNLADNNMNLNRHKNLKFYTSDYSFPTPCEVTSTD
jgi:hypothetical protein